jgi:hypothetical protein
MKAMVLSGCICLFLMACAAPRTTVQTDDQSGTVVFKVTPSYADVFVDGKKVGIAREFNGQSSVLKLSPGTHIIRLEAENYKPYEQKIYISDTQELIEVNLEGK